jgi:hypothetical protein
MCLCRPWCGFDFCRNTRDDVNCEICGWDVGKICPDCSKPRSQEACTQTE